MGRIVRGGAPRTVESRVRVCVRSRGARRETMIRRRHTAVVLMYHSVVTADRDPFWIRVAPEHFEAHLVELDQLARVVPLRAIFDDDDPTPRVAITFD